VDEDSSEKGIECGTAVVAVPVSLMFLVPGPAPKQKYDVTACQ
jgi:hypothetical protein